MKTEHRLAADVILEHKGKILLAKRNAEPFKGKFEIPGGFVNPGEPVDQAALREIKEEADLDIKIKGVLGIYCYTTNKIRKCSMAVAFVAESDTDKVVLSEEADELKWVRLKDIGPEDLAYDHSLLISHYKDWLKNKKTFMHTETE